MIQSGTVVTIKFGPFAGFAATMVSSRYGRVVVRLVLRNESSILVELDHDMVERLVDRSAQVSSL